MNKRSILVVDTGAPAFRQYLSWLSPLAHVSVAFGPDDAFSGLRRARCDVALWCLGSNSRQLVATLEKRRELWAGLPPFVYASPHPLTRAGALVLVGDPVPPRVLWNAIVCAAAKRHVVPASDRVRQLT